MNLLKITEVSKNFNISTRTLRYYEQIGLLKSTKKDDYAYRVYDENAILRLQQIIVLRKLRIPLKQIMTVLESENTIEIIKTFKIKPDTRLYGFNNPNPVSTGHHGYEVWATIPDTLKVPSPLMVKSFSGGLYAAHTSKPINFDEWKFFYDWLRTNDEFEYDRRKPFGMDGCLEEHFNSYNLYGLKNPKVARLSHIDFLIPIKERK